MQSTRLGDSRNDTTTVLDDMPRGVYNRSEWSTHSNNRGNLAEQFWKRVCKDGPLPPNIYPWFLTTRCWIWQAGKYASGYGQFRGKKAHRVAYTLIVGAIPENNLVLHKCDIQCCTNPDHLFLGTPQSNMDDKVAKERQSHKGCSANPPIGEANAKAKLTELQVLTAREMYTTGSSLQQIIQYLHLTVCPGTLRAAISGKTWKHLR